MVKNSFPLGFSMPIPAGATIRASHFLIKHENSRNPVSRRTNESTAELKEANAQAEMDKWIETLKADERPMPEKFAALAHHRHHRARRPAIARCRRAVLLHDVGCRRAGGVAVEGEGQ